MPQTIDWNDQKKTVRAIVTDIVLNHDDISHHWLVKSTLTTVEGADEYVTVSVVVRDTKAHEDHSYYVGSYPVVEDGADLNVLNLWMLARDVALRVSEGLKASWGMKV